MGGGEDRGDVLDCEHRRVIPTGAPQDLVGVESLKRGTGILLPNMEEVEAVNQCVPCLLPL